jgi:hypothetical protein
VDDDDRSTRWIPGGVLVMSAALALAACREGIETVCPAIGWSNSLVVTLAGDWPPVEGGSVAVDCAPRCGETVVRDGAPVDRDRLTAPLDTLPVVLHLDMSAPDSVDVRVLGPDGSVLAGLAADLDWVRVGGSEECGGPMEAVVTVPAP